MEGLVVLLIGGAVCGIIAACIASAKGRSGVAWFFAGLFTGIIGVIIVALKPSRGNCEPNRRSPGGSPEAGAGKPQNQGHMVTTRDIQLPPPKSPTTEQSVEAIVRQLVEGVLGDVIPRPNKERNKSYRGIRDVYPHYVITWRYSSEYPNFDSNPYRNARVHDKLYAIKERCCSEIAFGHTYNSIARVPSVLVTKVECYEKPGRPPEIVLQNWI